MSTEVTDLLQNSSDLVTSPTGSLDVQGDFAHLMAKLSESVSYTNLFKHCIEVLMGTDVPKRNILDAMVVLTTLISPSLGSPLFTAVVENQEDESGIIVRPCLRLVHPDQYVDVDTPNIVRQYCNSRSHMPIAFVIREKILNAKDVIAVLDVIKTNGNHSCLVIGSNEFVSSVKFAGLIKFPLNISEGDFVLSLTTSQEISHIQKIKENLIRKYSIKLTPDRVDSPYLTEVFEQCLEFIRNNMALAQYFKNLIACIAQMNKKMVDTGALVYQSLAGDDGKESRVHRNIDGQFVGSDVVDYYCAYLMMKNSNIGQLSLSQRQQDVYAAIKEINLGLMGSSFVEREASDAEKERHLADFGASQEQIFEVIEKNTGNSISPSILWSELKYLSDKGIVAKERVPNSPKKFAYSVTNLNVLTRKTFPHPSCIKSFESQFPLEMINPFTGESEVVK